MNEACGVFHSCLVCLGVGAVESKVEVEVGELLLQLKEVFNEECLNQSTRAIEEMHLAVAGVESLRHVHNLGAERSHTGTTTYPYHLFLRVENRVEVAVRTTHNHLVAWLAREDVTRRNTCRNILEAYLRTWFERCGGDADGEGDAVALGRIVGHRVCTDSVLRIVSLQREDVELLPRWQIVWTDVVLVEILVVVDAVVCRNLYLCIRAGDEVHVLAWRQCHDELLDET